MGTSIAESRPSEAAPHEPRTEDHHPATATRSTGSSERPHRREERAHSRLHEEVTAYDHLYFEKKPIR